MIKSEGRLVHGDVAPLLWRRRALGESSMLCTVFNNSICCHGESIKKCSLWKESKIKNDLFMSLFQSASAIRRARTPGSAVCPVLSATHPHAAYLIVTGLYPETQGWLTMVDWQVCRVSLSSSWLHHALFLGEGLHPPRHPALAHRCFKFFFFIFVGFFSFLFFSMLNNVASVFAFDSSPCKPQQNAGTLLVKSLRPSGRINTSACFILLSIFLKFFPPQHITTLLGSSGLYSPLYRVFKCFISEEICVLFLMAFCNFGACF